MYVSRVSDLVHVVGCSSELVVIFKLVGEEAWLRVAALQHLTLMKTTRRYLLSSCFSSLQYGSTLFQDSLDMPFTVSTPLYVLNDIAVACCTACMCKAVLQNAPVTCTFSLHVQIVAMNSISLNKTSNKKKEI